MIIYNGPSQLNGKPIVAILTLDSDNRKTGRMAQLWILSQRVTPTTAVKTGYDAAVCGNCPLRPSTGGACYVNAGHGPRSVWLAWRAGRYVDNTALKPFAFLKGLKVRLGAYGDPAALPLNVVQGLLALTGAGWTGYTHQWRDCEQGYKAYLMASVEDGEGLGLAEAMGWRTFRVVRDYSENTGNERVCANDSHGTQCIDCMACHGGPGVGITILVHGPKANRFMRATA